MNFQGVLLMSRAVLEQSNGEKRGRAFILFTCQPIALSVRHCKASPSGTRMFRLCRETRSERMASMRGRRDLIHSGHKNLIAFMYITVLVFSPLEFEVGTLTAPFANGTQFTTTHAQFSSDHSIVTSSSSLPM